MKETGWFGKVVGDIAALRIQGAEAVARAGAEAVARLAREHRRPPKRQVERLLAARPTEPMLRNGVAYLLAHEGMEERALANLLRRFDEADAAIARYAAGLISTGAYFTHCHSSTVIAAFLAAKRAGKGFSVHNTETRPRFQGRQTARDLAAAGIPVRHGVDSAARVLLQGCRAVFLGADALLSDGWVANKIGSEMIAELAHERAIPVYVLAASWKFAGRGRAAFKRSLEEREPAEVWREAPSGVRVENPAFEFIDPRFVTAIVTERGIRDPRSCARELMTIRR